MANTSSFTPEQLAELQQLFIDFFQKNGSALGEGQVRELTPEELTSETLEALTIPSMMPSTEEWVQTSLTNMMGPLNTSKAAADAATQNANNAASAANTAVTYAERVNATMDGMEITVIDRNGVSITKNIGFDMVGTYGSIAEMKADAADVEEGKFVIIATDDPTATDNAKLFVRNSNAATSQNPFSFCADLDQASAAAWADWLDNMKPQIEGPRWR